MNVTWDVMKDRFDRNGPELQRSLGPLLESPILLQFVKEKILLDWQKDDLLDIPNRNARCDKFLGSLRSGSLQNTQTFCAVMRRNNQSHIADILDPAQVSPANTSASAPLAGVLSEATGTEGGVEIELPPWDKKSKGGDNLVFQSKEYKGCLNKKRSMLVEATPNFMPGFWDALIELEVLTARDRTRIQHGVTQEEAVGNLVDNINKGTVWRLHGLLRAYGKVEAEAIIKQLGFDPSVYCID